MTSPAANLARVVAGHFGFRVTRLTPLNRFQAMSDTLHLLKTCGYAPRVVIDGGANEGQWFTLARQVFPGARFHLVEPQPVYTRRLQALARPCDSVHPVALTAPGPTLVRMIGASETGSTGAFVAAGGEAGADVIEVPATTLDALFASPIAATDRALLKLDLEGHELPALAGSHRLLGAIEVIIAEVRFYENSGDGRKPFADVLFALRERGFEIFDIAALCPRTRVMRLRQGDVVFVRRDAPLAADNRWD